MPVSKIVSVCALLLFSSSILLPDVAHAQGQTPAPVQDMAFMRAGQYLYIQGGDFSVNTTQKSLASQLFALDLSTSWSVSSPPWKALADGPPARSFYGVSTPDNQTLITFMVQPPATYNMAKYDVQQNTWQLSPVTNNDTSSYGIRPVVDPNTGLIYFAGVNNMDIFNPQTNVWTYNSIPPSILTSKYFAGAVYNVARKTIMHLGGYNYGIAGSFESTAYISEYSPSTITYSTLITTGDPPSPRADHCMAVSEDGGIVVVFGGRLSPTLPKFTGTFYILDVATKVWKQGTALTPRIYMACVIVGNQFVAWGGFDGNETITGPPIVFDLTLNQWVSTYTAPSYYPTSTKPGSNSSSSPTGSTDSGSSNSSTPPAGSKTSSFGAIIGGVVGGIALFALVGVTFYYKGRKNERLRNEALTQSRMINEAERVNEVERTNNKQPKTPKSSHLETNHSSDAAPPQYQDAINSAGRSPRSPAMITTPGGPQEYPAAGRSPQCIFNDDIPLIESSSTRRNPQNSDMSYDQQEYHS
ncbi:hypothetical protein BGZ58_005004 [Dissophora ornata]|nr:hypothetical protein BGZ58_005004 [Dissophora ornata]